MGTFRIALVSNLANAAEVRNVFTFDHPTAGTIPADSAIGEYFDSIWTPTLLALLSDSWHATRFIVEVPDGAGHWGYVHEGVYVRNGGANYSALPNQMAAVIIGVTASRRRGKKFIAGLTEEYGGSGGFGAPTYAALLVSAQAYVLPIVDGAIEYACGVCRPDGSDFLEFNSFRVDTLLGTQRRRKPGVGS